MLLYGVVEFGCVEVITVSERCPRQVLQIRLGKYSNILISYIDVERGTDESYNVEYERVILWLRSWK